MSFPKQHKRQLPDPVKPALQKNDKDLRLLPSVTLLTYCEQICLLSYANGLMERRKMKNIKGQTLCV